MRMTMSCQKSDPSLTQHQSGATSASVQSSVHRLLLLMGVTQRENEVTRHGTSIELSRKSSFSLDALAIDRLLLQQQPRSQDIRGTEAASIAWPPRSTAAAAAAANPVNGRQRLRVNERE